MTNVHKRGYRVYIFSFPHPENHKDRRNGKVRNAINVKKGAYIQTFPVPAMETTPLGEGEEGDPELTRRCRRSAKEEGAEEEEEVEEGHPWQQLRRPQN